MAKKRPSCLKSSEKGDKMGLNRWGEARLHRVLHVTSMTVGFIIAEMEMDWTVFIRKT